MPRARDWSQLGTPYRQRLMRNGIGQREYEGGMPLRLARGHAPAEIQAIENTRIRTAAFLGFNQLVPGNELLPEEERSQLAELYTRGMMRPGETEPQDRLDRIAFLEMLDDVRLREPRVARWNRERWDQFRNGYNRFFGSRR